MKHFLYFTIFFFIGFSSLNAQVRYINYCDTIKVLLTDSLKKEIGGNITSQGNVDSSLINDFFEDFSKNLQTERFIYLKQKKDTARVTFTNNTKNKFFKFEFNNPDILVLKDGFFVVDERADLFKKIDWLNDSLVETNQELNILGYLCKLYKTVDEKKKVWVTNSLSKLINPLINLKGLNGAVLKYYIETETMIQTGLAKDFIDANKDNIVLYKKNVPQ